MEDLVDADIIDRQEGQDRQDHLIMGQWDHHQWVGQDDQEDLEDQAEGTEDMVGQVEVLDKKGSKYIWTNLVLSRFIPSSTVYKNMWRVFFIVQKKQFDSFYIKKVEHW